MDELHKELLSELIKDWTIVQLDTYLNELEVRAVQLDRWIKHVKTIKRKRTRKPVYDTGVRGGA